MSRTSIDFGIDLGTTNSTVAVIDNIDAKVIPNKVGSGITPSAVWIDKRGSIHVGQEAKLRALVEDQDNADVEFKLRMGLGPEGRKVFVRSGRELLPEELSAEVLKSLKLDAQSNMSEELRAVVITVPAAFENPQTNATQRAAQLAGFGRSPLLLEPVAASLAYGFQSESENVYWFVYDFGGGTFDAAVMRIRDGLIQVVNHNGDNFLGGKLLDWAIVTSKLVPAITGQFNLPEFRRGVERWRSALGKMKYYAEQAKIDVCRSRTAQDIHIENLCEDADGRSVDFEYRLTPEDVEQVSRPFSEMSLSMCRKTLEEAGLTGGSMERILMVGGTTLNPWVREAVQSELGSRIEVGIDPVTVVARGAAIFASTQALPRDPRPVAAGTWRIEIDHKPVGNVADPDIGGRLVAPAGETVAGYTIELIDLRTSWRSGRVGLGPGGVFMTQLYAEKQRRHEYRIELSDTTGNLIVTEPDHVSYTIGVIPEVHQPAAMTIGVGLDDGGVAPYVNKGQSLPARKSMDHFTTIALRAGHAEDQLRIPLLEGEHRKAERNHGIGVMVITGSDIRRDLPSDSQIELTLLMDSSQQVKVQAYVPALDEDFEVCFDAQMKHQSLAELQKETEQQKARLADAREKAERTSALKAEAALLRVDQEQLLDHVDSLVEAAASDPDALAQLDRRLQDLAAAVDDVEDAVEWPVLLEKAGKSRQDSVEVVEKHGEAGDRSRLLSLTAELQRAMDTGDPDLLRRYVEELDNLEWQILDRQPGFHVARFGWLSKRVEEMRDAAQAQQIIAQGRRAMSNNDIEALKAANRQLFSLLPREVQVQDKHPNRGQTRL